MILYIDENMSPYLAKGFHILQMPLNQYSREDIEVLSIKDAFGQGVTDEEWIPTAGKQGACIITQDHNIQRIKHQRALCQQYDLGMFYVRPPSRSGYKYWDMVKVLVKHWEQIVKIALREKRPFAYRLTSKGDIEPME